MLRSTVTTWSTTVIRISVWPYPRNDGLVVPVLRDADFMSLADVEAAIVTSV
jgi:pyruvate/2-oxoglutarate dehydrogenase complex dihydrolipoamide acyltransferase (E2) component